MSDQYKAVPSEDYRDSHKSKGARYDQTLFSLPFDAYMDKWEAHYLNAAIERLFPERVPRYLDFACGTGRITARVEARVSESVGVDVSETMLAVARSKCPGTRFVCADLTRDNVDLGIFDLVTSFRFFGNAQDDLRSSVLTSINRCLRPGGWLIINSHRNPHSFLGIAGRSAARGVALDLTYGKLKALLRRHGFEISSSWPIGFWIFRFKLTSADVLESKYANALERLFRHPFLARYAPDAVVVARKMGDGIGG